MKIVMHNWYVHKSNIKELGLHPYDWWAIDVLERDMPNYQVVKYDIKNNTISGIESPDWDTSNEPIVGDSMMIDLNSGEITYRKGRTKNFQIYHNKWQFVSSDYKGFDVEEAKRRTEEWNSIPGIEKLKSKIGNQDFWFELLDKNGIER